MSSNQTCTHTTTRQLLWREPSRQRKYSTPKGTKRSTIPTRKLRGEEKRWMPRRKLMRRQERKIKRGLQLMVSNSSKNWKFSWKRLKNRSRKRRKPIEKSWKRPRLRNKRLRRRGKKSGMPLISRTEIQTTIFWPLLPTLRHRQNAITTPRQRENTGIDPAESGGGGKHGRSLTPVTPNSKRGDNWPQSKERKPKAIETNSTMGFILTVPFNVLS